MTLPKTLPGRALVAVRFVLGVGSWFAPSLALKVIGAKDPDDPESVWVMRMFAVRDAILGVGLLATKGEHRKLWWRIGIACDAADLAGGIIAARHPTKHRRLMKLAPTLGVLAFKQDDV